MVLSSNTLVTYSGVQRLFIPAKLMTYLSCTLCLTQLNFTYIAPFIQTCSPKCFTFTRKIKTTQTKENACKLARLKITTTIKCGKQIKVNKINTRDTINIKL